MSRLAPFEPLDAGLKRTLARDLFAHRFMAHMAAWAREELKKPFHQVMREYEERMGRRAQRRLRGRHR